VTVIDSWSRISPVRAAKNRSTTSSSSELKADKGLASRWRCTLYDTISACADRAAYPAGERGTAPGMETFDLDASLAEHAGEDYSTFGLPWRPMRPGEMGAFVWAYVRLN
jgi:hypothetical protein